MNRARHKNDNRYKYQVPINDMWEDQLLKLNDFGNNGEGPIEDLWDTTERKVEEQGDLVCKNVVPIKDLWDTLVEDVGDFEMKEVVPSVDMRDTRLDGDFETGSKSSGDLKYCSRLSDGMVLENFERLGEEVAKSEIGATTVFAKTVYKWDIVWSNVILLFLLHLGAVYGFYLRFSSGKLSTIIFAKIVGSLSALGVTAGAHRLWSHKTYKANGVLQVLLAAMMTLTYQNSIFVWCRDHRLHHKFTETDADPHNAKRGFFFSHIGWLMVRKHRDVIEKGKLVDMSDLSNNKIVMFQHKHYKVLVTLWGFVLPTLIPYCFMGENLASSFFIATVYRYIVSVHVTWSINSFAHLYGQKPYNRNIGATENPLMIYCSFGEGFHNYHHTFPWDYKASEYGADCRNLTTVLIDFFAWVGWAWDLKVAAKKLVETRAQRTGDGSIRGPNSWTWRKMRSARVERLRSLLLFSLYMYVI